MGGEGWGGGGNSVPTLTSGDGDLWGTAAAALETDCFSAIICISLLIFSNYRSSAQRSPCDHIVYPAMRLRLPNPLDIL